MFFNSSSPDWGFSPKFMFNKAEDGEDFNRRGMDDLRGRHQAFRMPAWVPEDEDMSDLAARMSHTPHFATVGRRGGPWRERRSSGGSAMSATSEDDSYDTAATDKSSQCSGGSSDAPSHEIPIRIEAPAPPTSAQQENEPVAPLSSRVAGLRKSTQYPVRTTSAVDASDHSEEVPRTTRCASAPPEMAEQPLPQDPQTPPTQQRFVSKISITPQAPQCPGSPHSKATPVSPLPHKFNTVPKPFVPANKQQQETQHQQQPQQFSEEQQQQQMPDSQWQYQQPQHQYQQYPQQNQEPQQYTYQQQQQPPPPPPPQQPTRQGNQRPSVVRNIPIFVEGRDGPLVNEETSNQPKPSTQWGQPWQQQQQYQAQQQQQHYQPQQQHYQQQQQHYQPQQQHHQQYQSHQQQPQQQQAHQQQRQQKPMFKPHPQTQQAPPEPIPQPVPMPMPEHMSQQQPQPQPQDQTDSGPQSKTQPLAKDSRLAQIEAVRASVEEYREKVNAFEGTKKNREFLYLDEMLTRALLQLDNIDPDGCDDVRQARRAAIKDINAAISALETKASEPQVAVKSQEPVAESMETDTNQGQPISATNEHPPTDDVAQQVSDTSGIQENVQQQHEQQQQPVEPTTDGASTQVATAAEEVDKKLEQSASMEMMETEPQIPGSTSNGSPPDDAAAVTST